MKANRHPDMDPKRSYHKIARDPGLLQTIAAPAHRSLKATLLSFFLALPWCCLLPGVLSLASFGTAFTAHFLSPTFLLPTFLVSLFALLYAHYRLWVRKHGSPVSRLTTIILTPLILALWYFRLSVFL